jgi:hypothetical protein
VASEPTVIVPPKQLGPAAHVSVAVLLIVPLLAEWPDVTQQFIRPVQRQEFPATRRSFCGSVVMAAAGSFLGRGSAAGDQVLVAAGKSPYSPASIVGDGGGCHLLVADAQKRRRGLSIVE